MHVCFLSNGYGEDRSAALIAAELAAVCPSIKITGAPLLSAGSEYEKRGIEVVATGKTPPSGGFPTRSFRGFILDLFGGFFHRSYIRKLRAACDGSPAAVAVGDVTLLLIGYIAFRRPLAFFATAKSNYMHPHFRIEEFFIRRFASVIFTRDIYTRDCLKKRGINAEYIGNLLMEKLEPARSVSFGDPPIVGVLPGSRDEAYENFLRILDVIELVKRNATYACAAPSSLSIEKLIADAASRGWSCSENVIEKNGKRVIVARDSFEEILDQAELFIGLAGTANEQAAGLGKPVVTFAGAGAQTTPGRMTDQEKLLGGGAKYIADFPAGVAAEVDMLLSNPSERARRGALGKERMGESGAAGRAAKALVELFRIC